MRYRPVYVAKIITMHSTANLTKAEWFAAASEQEAAGNFYWEACSKMLGNCGHKHTTEEEAEPCAERMQEEWHKRRSESIKAAAAKRRRS